MRWARSVVAGLVLLAGCGVENDPMAALSGLQGVPPVLPPTRITVEPGAVIFPRTTVGRPVAATVRFRNNGEGAAVVLLSIPEPFTVELPSLTLFPGDEQTVVLRLDPTRAGTTGAVLFIQAEERRIEVTARGEVDPAPGAGGPRATPPP